MNREIKFRIWKPKAQRMDYIELENYLVGSGIYDQKTGCNELGKIWMQFTGLKDKTGKDIYEGDILKSAHSVPLQVIFEDGKFCFHNDHSTGADILSQMRTERLEIIGNIYQNPDLLTK